MVDFTTTYTTTTTFMRFALCNDALRRVVAVAIRRARRVRRGYIKSSEAAIKTWHYYSLLEAREVAHDASSLYIIQQSCYSR